MTSVEPNKQETSYTLAEPAVVAGHKQGHNCCGGCCDTRRAVIIVNIVNACIVGFGLMGVLAVKNAANSNMYDDDEMAAALADFENAPVGMAIGLMVAQIVASLCGIAGGIKFNVILTAVAAVAYSILTVFGLIGGNIAGLIYNGFFLYPHVMFIQEMRKGIMTEANYPNEKHSCCCV